MKKQSPKRDLYQEVTDSVVAALESAGEWHRPWTDMPFDALAPRSVDGRAYRGVNTLLLWAAAMEHGYEHGVWGTYNAWSAHGAQVRKGEHGTLVTLWKPYQRKASDAEVQGGKADADGRRPSLLLRHYTVFNVEQVDGYELPTVEPVEGPSPVEHAESFFAAVGADVTYTGSSAYYTPALDKMVVPPLEQFESAEAFYATLAHEHGHWTGHKSRLDRPLNEGRFGNEAYAFEELVAELSAAFTGAYLGVETSVRADHASYVKSWLRVLKSDNKAVFTAASQAQKATDFLVAKAGENGHVDEEPAAEAA